MGMLGRYFSIFLLLMVFTSSSNASIDCLGTNSGDYSGCTGFICKRRDGKTKVYTGATDEFFKDLELFCEQSWDEVKDVSTYGISIAPNEYKSVDRKYFVFSCQDNFCNNQEFMIAKLTQYQKEINDAGLAVVPFDGEEKCLLSDGTEIFCTSEAPPQVNYPELSLSKGNENGGGNNSANRNGTDVTPPNTTGAPGGGAETIGNGFAFLMAPLFASFFLL